MTTEPWWNHLTDAEKLSNCEALLDFIFRPSFGSRSKREVELKIFELLYLPRAGTASLGAIAKELGVTRSRARTLVLECRARQVALLSEEELEAQLLAAVRTWPVRGQIERDGTKLRVVIDDPSERELLKNHAYAKAIVFDGSFASEVVSFGWSSYVRLLNSLGGGEEAMKDVANDLAARVRKSLVAQADLQAEFDAELKKYKKTDYASRLLAVGRFAAAHAGEVATLGHMVSTAVT